MHTTVMTIGYPHHTQDFIKYFQRKHYENGDPWQVRTREIKFWDFVFPEVIEKQVIGDLLYFGRDPKHIVGSIDKLKKLIKLYGLFCNGKKMEPINPAEYKVSQFDISEFKEPDGRYWWCYAYPIAKMNDGHHPNPSKGHYELL